MSNNVPMYSAGDILQRKEDKTDLKIILYVCDSFYDETGYSKETYYYVKYINDDRYPPFPMNESSITNYYTKISHPTPKNYYDILFRL
jgi:hypothetical protein